MEDQTVACLNWYTFTGYGWRRDVGDLRENGDLGEKKDLGEMGDLETKDSISYSKRTTYVSNKEHSV